jgi:hypothetical protein
MKNRFGAWFLLLAACTAFGLVGATQQPDEQKLKAEWAAFVKEYDAAYKEWIRPFTEAKTEEERNKVKLDFDKMPGKTYLPRAAAIARRAGKGETAFSAWYWVLQNAQQSGETALGKEALDAFMRDHINSPKLGMITMALAYGTEPAEGEKMLQAILEKSPHKDVKIAALGALAELNMPYSGGTLEQTAKARKYLERIIKEAPESNGATRAKTALFELDNLQIGMTAPDFEAEDQNGVKFKLSDYRGKVVILDFWGFW